jgi:hypothetical protein
MNANDQELEATYPAVSGVPDGVSSQLLWDWLSRLL